MNKQITLNLNEEMYRKFKAALMLTGEEEETVLNGLISKYVHKVFSNVMGKSTADDTNIAEKSSGTAVSAEEQKQAFVNWFRSLTRNGKAYNPVTISGYTGRLENACADPVFAAVPVNNLFSITNPDEFSRIQKQIKSCEGYSEFDARSHNGFTAALRKYEEFLRFQSGGGVVPASPSKQPLPYSPSNNHRWTMEEDAICCKRFLEYYVIKQSSMDTTDFLKMLAKEVPEVSEGSLRMKIQNVKYLTVQAGLKNTSNIRWLSQYSSQCETAFKQAAAELGLFLMPKKTF